MKNSPHNTAKHKMTFIEYGFIGAFIAVAIIGSMHVVDAQAFGMNMPALNAVTDTAIDDSALKAD